MGIERRDVEDYLASVEVTIAGMGVEYNPVPEWVNDQMRAMMASKLPSTDLDNVLSFFAGMFVATSCACIYGHVAHSHAARSYFVALAHTIRAAAPLLDAPAPVPPAEDFATWDDLLRRLEDGGCGTE